jgi:hypothetical protein
MKKIIFIITSVLFLTISLSAQKNKTITVMAGTKVLDYFPAIVRYRYPEFLDGQIIFKNGRVSNGRFNYNFLLSEMEFIQGVDTLSISKKKDINTLTVGNDIYFYDSGYLEMISDGQVRVVLKQYYKLTEVLRKNGFGVATRGASVDSYNSMTAGGNFYDLVPNEDMVFQKTFEYSFSIPSGNFVQFRKKNVLQQFPQKNVEIQQYLKTNKVNFESQEDLLRFAEYLGTL